jgi:transcriptional regulator with XRE-family HTH domain
MNIKNENFATALDWLVQNKGIDGQKGLAEATGISTNTISRIMTGKVQPSDATLRVLADKFDFNMEWLRGRPGQPMFVDKNHHECANTHESPSVDLDFYHQALKINADVIADLRRNVEYFQQLVLDKDSLIQEHNEQIVALNIDKAKLATELEHLRTTLDAVRNNFDAKVIELEKRDQIIKTLQSVIDRESRGDYRIPTGVAEPPAAYNNDKK